MSTELTTVNNNQGQVTGLAASGILPKKFDVKKELIPQNKKSVPFTGEAISAIGADIIKKINDGVPELTQKMSEVPELAGPLMSFNDTLLDVTGKAPSKNIFGVVTQRAKDKYRKNFKTYEAELEDAQKNVSALATTAKATSQNLKKLTDTLLISIVDLEKEIEFVKDMYNEQLDRFPTEDPNKTDIENSRIMTEYVRNLEGLHEKVASLESIKIMNYNQILACDQNLQQTIDIANSLNEVKELVIPSWKSQLFQMYVSEENKKTVAVLNQTGEISNNIMTQTVDTIESNANALHELKKNGIIDIDRLEQCTTRYFQILIEASKRREIEFETRNNNIKKLEEQEKVFFTKSREAAQALIEAKPEEEKEVDRSFSLR